MATLDISLHLRTHEVATPGGLAAYNERTTISHLKTDSAEFFVSGGGGLPHRLRSGAACFFCWRTDDVKCSVGAEHVLMENERAGATHVMGFRLALLVFCDYDGSGHGNKNRPAAGRVKSIVAIWGWRSILGIMA